MNKDAKDTLWNRIIAFDKKQISKIIIGATNQKEGEIYRNLLIFDTSVMKKWTRKESKGTTNDDEDGGQYLIRGKDNVTENAEWHNNCNQASRNIVRW